MNVVVLGESRYENLFREKGFNVNSVKDYYNNLKNINLIVFTGGTDVNPAFYGEERNFRTCAPDLLRDELEHDLFNKAVINEIPMVGICRGAQALCVWSGGKLIQHVEKHCEYHLINTSDSDQDTLVSSTHHQMMYPWDIEHKILGWALGRSRVYLNGEDKQISFSKERMILSGKTIEPEVVYFPETNALSHQPHPEYMQKGSPYVQYFWKTIEEYLNIKV